MSDNSSLDRHQRTMWNKDFGLLFAGQSISQLGTAAYTVALPMFVLQSGSAVMLGVVMAAALVPFTLLAPFAGVLVDRWPRKLVIVGTDLLSGILVLIVSYFAWRGDMSITLLVVASAGLSVFGSFFMPAVMASVPNMVPKSQLTRSMALLDITRQVSQVAGPAVGGVLILALGFPGAFFINGISFLVSGLSELFMYVPQTKRTSALMFFAELKSGWMYIVREKAILAIVCLVMVMNLFEPAIIPVVFPVLITELGLSAATYGTLKAVFAVGATLAMVVLGLTGDLIHKALLFLIGMIVIGASLLMLSLVYNYPLILAIIGLYGLSAGICNTVILVIIQSLIPDEVRGRVFGTVATMSAAMMPVSYIAIGFALERVSTAPILAIAGVFMIIGAGLWARIAKGSEQIQSA